MLILRRLAIWFLETLLEALLLAVFFSIWLGCDFHECGHGIWLTFVWIGLMFFSTGYLLTTGIARAVWRGSTVKLYPVVGAVLFLFHFEILNYDVGGISNLKTRIALRIAGVCIVVACTYTGNLILRKWTMRRSVA